MKSISLSLILALATSAWLSADTIRLMDGSQLEGTIIAEDEESYTVQVQVTPTIKDEKRIPKADVAGVDRSGPDDIAFKELADFIPTPDRLTPDDYRDRITKAEAFLNAFPQSRHAENARKILTKLQNELKLADDGALKLEGSWITAEDRAANAYDLDARLHAEDMDAAARAGQYRDALRHFEILQRDYLNTSHFRSACDRAKQALVAYRALINTDLAEVENRIKQREEGIARLPAADRAVERAAVERRDNAYLRRIEHEKEQLETKWLTIDPYHAEPMEEALEQIEQTLEDIGTALAEPRHNAGPVFRQAWEAANSGDRETARDLTAELRNLKVPARYIERIEAKLEPPEEPGSAAPKSPGDTAETDETPESAEDDKPSKPSTDQDAGAPDEPAAPLVPDYRDAGGKEGGFPFRLILIAVMAIVIVVALVVAFSGKKNK